MNSTNQPTSEESDLPFAAFLVAKGFVVMGTRLDGHRVFFRFGLAPHDVERLRRNFLRGAIIAAQHYAHTMRQLKKLAFSVINEAGR